MQRNHIFKNVLYTAALQMNELSITVPDFAVCESQPSVRGREFAIILIASLRTALNK